MTRHYTIAHISDLHLSTEFRRQNIRSVKRMLDYLDRQDVDHVVITGDIAATTDPRDFSLARSLLASYGLLDSLRATIIPGNHDVFGGVHAAEDILDFPSKCSHTDLDRALRQFSGHFPELFKGCDFGRNGHPYPFIKDLGPVALIGINSVAPYSVVKNPFGSNGGVDKTQLHALRTMLSTTPLKHKARIVLIHHHFNKPPKTGSGTLGGMWESLEQQTMKLRGKKRLVEFFRKERIDLVLHGHFHANSSYGRGGVQFLNAGGCVMGPANDTPTLYLVHVDRNVVSTEIHRIPSNLLSVNPPQVIPDIPLAIAS